MRSRFARIVTVLLTAAASFALSGAWLSPATAAVQSTYTEYPVGINGGEPSIGFDPIRNAAMYGAGTDTRRLTWSATGAMTSTDVKAPTAKASLDAITMVDQNTGRTFNAQLMGACSLTSFSDNAGATWTPSQGCGEGTLLDHESLGAGPFHAPVPANPIYPDAVYYCAQNGFNASCATSFDGGLTFGPGVYVQNTPANDPNDPNPQFAAEGGACVGLHGHLKVGPDGTAYLPLAGCGGQPTLNDGTNYEYWGGRPALSISPDNGATWTIDMIPAGNVSDGRGGTNPVSAMDEGDPSVSISRPGRGAPNGNVYFAWQNGTDKSDVQGGTTSQAMVAVSHDDGATWSKPVDVSSPIGLHNVMFTEIVAGNSNIASVAFLGTAAVGDTQTNAFPTTPAWHLYVATTYNGGRTWRTVDATPTDPVQRGCIDMQGTTIPPSPRADVCSQRNLLDFNDITVDRNGRVLVAYSDGCDAACAANPSSHSSGAVDMVVRQTGGIGLYGKPVHR